MVILRWALVLAVVLVTVVIVYFKINNNRTDLVGLINDEFISCPNSPNCVSSQEKKEDKKHYIEPIIYEKERSDIQFELEQYLGEMKSVNIVLRELGYIHIEVKSDTVGYIDDVEFYLPKDIKVVHVKSASRVGYSDKGVNRARIEKIRAGLLKISELEH